MKLTQEFESATAGGVSPPAKGGGVLGVALRRLVRHGVLTVTDHKGHVRHYGTPDPGFPDVAIRLYGRRTALRMVLQQDLGVAEAFMDGRLLFEKGDIRDFIRLIQKNNRWEINRSRKKKGGFRDRWNRLTRNLRQMNLPGRSRQNVAHHYDLDAGLYAHFLDSDRQYSCAYFERPDATLEEAQLAKKKHIAEKMMLKPGQRVLDIGCGWGGMALYLHRNYGVDVLGITLSREQLAIARQRAEEAGVADKVRFELVDYRAVEGQFDRIVSVGMFEHVGAPHYREYFRVCRNLLTSDGVMLLHTIGRSDEPAYTDAFTRKYIFPGGYIPAMSEVLAAIEPNNLMVTDVEVLRLHYAKTLNHWYDRIVANREAIEKLYDERFFRMWTFYLAGAMSAFEYRALVNFQFQITRDRHVLPLTRDYMIEAG